MNNGFIKLHGGPDGDAFLVNPTYIVTAVPKTAGKPGCVVYMGWGDDHRFHVKESVDELEHLLEQGGAKRISDSTSISNKHIEQ